MFGLSKSRRIHKCVSVELGEIVYTNRYTLEVGWKILKMSTQVGEPFKKYFRIIVTRLMIKKILRFIAISTGIC